MTTLIHVERRCQIDARDYGSAHENEHGAALLGDAAYSYRDALDACVVPPKHWPWDSAAWKPEGRQRNLERAGALYLAAADVAERAGEFGFRDQMREQANSCAVLLDSILPSQTNQ